MGLYSYYFLNSLYKKLEFSKAICGRILPILEDIIFPISPVRLKNIEEGPRNDISIQYTPMSGGSSSVGT